MTSQNFKVFIYLATITFSASSFSMVRALNTAATGMAAQESQVNTISNNIANVNTTGFKRSRTEFDDLNYQTIQEAGARSGNNTFYSVGTQIGSGSKVSATRKEFEQGGVSMTNNPFDLMVNGEGFLGVIMADNEMRFTRDGALNVDAQGNIVTKGGYKLYPGFTVPPGTKSVNISETGLVDAYTQGQTEPTNLGQIPVFTFVNPTGLKSAGGNLYQVSFSSGQASQNVAGSSNAGVIVQGALESSNVNIMTEMTNLIRAQRAYEMNSKVMGVSDQMMQTANNIK
jgi:flagellar basal-body rod protein FlgG